MITALRTLCLFAPALALAFARQPPLPRERLAALMAALTAAPFLFAVHLLARYFDWWHFEASGGTLAGFPIEVWAGWTILWGPLPLLFGAHLRWFELFLIAFLFDLALMPQLTPLLVLNERTWLLGEAVAIVLCLLPVQAFAGWTLRRQRPAARTRMQALAFGGWFVLIPLTALAEYTSQPLSPWILLALLPGLLGVAAACEFAERGNGTPVPMDPPERLVTTGPYAYVRNPMQVSICLVLPAAAGLMLWWAAPFVLVLVLAYSVGLARVDEDADLAERFGSAWQDYAAKVPRWWISWRPRIQEPAPAVTLSQALERRHLGWACLGWLIRAFSPSP